MLKPKITQPLTLLLAGATAFISFNTIFLAKSKIALPQSSPYSQLYVPSTESEGALLPDWERVTLRAIPPVAEAGSLDLSGLTEFLGYDPSRSWQQGDSITSILMLGDLASSTNLPTRSLWSILDAVGLSGDSLSLADFGVLQKQTLQTLLEAIPDLADFSLDEVPPLYDLVERELGSAIATNLGDLALGDLINDDQLAPLPLNSLNLEEYNLNSLPGLLDTPLEQFAGWGETLIDEIPGLADLPFSNFFIDLGGGGVFARLL